MMKYLMAFFAFLLLLGSPAAAQTAEDQQRIRQLASSLDQGWNAHDAELFVRDMAPDIQFITTGGRGLIGRASVESYHRRLFKGSASASRMETTGISLRFIKPDVGLMYRRWLIKSDRYSDGRPRADRTGITTVVVEKRLGRWLITTAQSTNTFVSRRGRNASAISPPEARPGE